MGSRIARRRAAVAWGVLMIVAGCALPRAEKPELEIARKAKPAPQTGPQQIGPALLVGAGQRLYAAWGSVTSQPPRINARLSHSDDGGRTWLQPPVSPEIEDSRGGVPQLFSGPDGALDAFWAIQSRAGEQQMLFQRSRDGGATWEAPVVIRSGKGLHRPLFLHQPGSFYAIIPEGTDRSSWKLEMHRSTDGGRHWTQLPTLQHAFARTGKGIRDFHARQDPQGQVHVVWSESDVLDMIAAIFYNRLVPGPDGTAAWLPRPIRISGESPASLGAMSPKIAFGGDGELTAIWEDQVHPDPQQRLNGAPPLKIKVSRSRDNGATWSSAVMLSAPGLKPFLAAGSALASDGGRHQYAMWVEGDADNLTRLKFARSDDGGATWQEGAGPQYEADQDTRLVASIQSWADAAGHVYLLWQQVDGDNWKLFFNRSADYGRTWMPKPYQLVRTPHASSKMHWVSVQAKEARVWVAFDGGPSPQSEIWLVRSHDHGATWSAREVQISR